MATLDYDEFGLFQENSEEFGIPWRGPPAVRREFVDVGDGRRVSALVWGHADPELVLVHGGAQNAHTWDTVALALDRPLVAVDLPGHGHSDWREDRRYWPADNAADVATAIRALAPSARLVVGMSLGGLTSVALAARHPELVPRLVLVDVTPGVDRDKAAPIAAFVAGPERFDSFDEILERTVAFNPTRTESSLRRGILHNARERDDGSWAWRYDRWRLGEGEDIPDFRPLWDDVSKLTMPLMLVRGADSGVVGDDDVAELRRRQPGVRVELVEGSGHSVQGDRPVELARLIESFLDG
ncbi:MAG TPA: alpha/beta hydrolase [Acidimicrobiia bacterium]|nr:alpha/beta hydrolase [Acidimicrobiia bacterium]